MGGGGASIQFSAMARRTRRRRRRSHTSKWKKVLVPLGVLFAALAVAAAAAGDLGGRRLQLGAAALQPAAGPEGPLVGDLRRRRQPDRLHPLQQHPPAGLDGAAAATTSRRRRSRSRTAASSTTARSTREAIVRAAWKNIEAGASRSQGASTITQQLVRNLYIQHPEQTIKRKLIEAHLAYEEEEAHSKTWILTAYLNTAPYGTVEGQTAVGAEAAAQTYFGKPAKDLDPDRGGADRRPAAGALRIQPLPRPAGGDRTAQRGARRDGGGGLHQLLRTSEARASGLGLNPGHKYKVIRDPFLFDLVQQELIEQVRDQHGPQRRPQGLHDDRPRTSGTRPGSGRIVRRLLPRRRPGGRPRLGQPGQRRDRRPRLDRRLRDRKPVQLRLAGAPAARLLVQDLRPDDGDQAGHRPRHRPTTTAPRR